MDSASNTLQQLVEQDPNDTALRLSYARVLVLRKEFAKAEAILTDLRAKQPDSILVTRAQIRLYVQQGNTDKAMQVCNEVVDKLHNAAAYLLRAEMYIDLRQNDKALEDLGQAIAHGASERGDLGGPGEDLQLLGPESPTRSPMCGGRWRWRRRSRESRSSRRPVHGVRQAVASAGGGGHARQGAGRAGRIRRKRGIRNCDDIKARILMLRATGPAIEEARQLLRQVTTDYPKYAEGWELMAQLELQQEEPGRAMDYATRGLAHNEQNKQLLLLKAIAEKRLSPSVAALTTLPTPGGAIPGRCRNSHRVGRRLRQSGSAGEGRGAAEQQVGGLHGNGATAM